MKIIYYVLCLLNLTIFNLSFAENEQSIKFGVILCQTGNCADWGKSATNGAILAKEKINQNGGILSKRIELVIEDTADSVSGAKSVTAFKNLYAKDLKFFIGPSWSPAALAIAPIASKLEDIIIITPSVSAREFSQNSKHIFNVRPPEDLATRELAKYFFSKGKRKMAIFSSQQPAESAQGKIFKEEFVRLGGDITIHLETNPTQTDLKIDALKISRTNPDAIFMAIYNQIEIGIKALRTLSYQGMLAAISLDDSRIKNSNGLFENLIISRAADPTKEFLRSYRQRFKEEPGLSAEGGFDAVNCLAQAISKTGSLSSTRKIINQLQQDDYYGAIGSFKFDQNREVEQNPVLYIVKDNKLKMLKYNSSN